MMRVDWEGEINGFWVHADYHWDWDTYGRERIVVIDDYAVYSEASYPCSPREEFVTEDELAETIEQRDAA